MPNFKQSSCGRGIRQVTPQAARATLAIFMPGFTQFLIVQECRFQYNRQRWAWSCDAWFDRSPLYLVMRLVMNTKHQVIDLPIFLHVDRAVVIIIVLGIVKRLDSSVVVC